MIIEPQMPVEAIVKKLKKMISKDDLPPGHTIDAESARQLTYLLCRHGFANTEFDDVPVETLEALALQATIITAYNLRALARRSSLPTGSDQKE
jgi:hypothetical protein